MAMKSIKIFEICAIQLQSTTFSSTAQGSYWALKKQMAIFWAG